MGCLKDMQRGQGGHIRALHINQKPFFTPKHSHVMTYFESSSLSFAYICSHFSSLETKEIGAKLQGD